MSKKLSDEREVIDIGGNDVDDISELERDIEDQMNAIFMEVGQDSRDEQFQIRVYKVLEKTGERASCFAALPSEMAGLMERIQEGFGAGLYEIWMYKNKRIYKRFKQHVLEPRKEANPVASVKNDMSAMMSAMIESNKQQFTQLKELMLMQNQNHQPAQTVQPTFNPMEMMQGMVAMMASMQSIIPKAEPQGNQFDTFMRAAEFIKDINPGGGAETNIFDSVGKAVEKFGPGLMDMTTKIAEAKASQVVQKMPLPSNLSQDGTPRQDDTILDPYKIPNPKANSSESPFYVPTENEKIISMQKLMFKKYVDILCSKAAEDADPLLYTDLILDNWGMLPPDFANRLLNDPNVINDFIDLNSTVASYREWFESLLSGLHQPDDLTNDAVVVDNGENADDDKIPGSGKISEIPTPIDVAKNPRRTNRD